MFCENLKICGVVINGNHIGRTIGFRTANICFPENLDKVENGVYLVKVKYNEKIYFGISNCGIKPTVSSKNEYLVEVHIFDFDKDIYGENIEVEFLKMIRKEKKFNSISELQQQIENDIKTAKKMFSEM